MLHLGALVFYTLVVLGGLYSNLHYPLGGSDDGWFIGGLFIGGLIAIIHLCIYFKAAERLDL